MTAPLPPLPPPPPLIAGSPVKSEPLSPSPVKSEPGLTKPPPYPAPVPAAAAAAAAAEHSPAPAPAPAAAAAAADDESPRGAGAGAAVERLAPDSPRAEDELTEAMEVLAAPLRKELDKLRNETDVELQ